MTPLIEELTELLRTEGVHTAKPGDVHQRADGDYEKQRDGSWLRLPAGHGRAVTHRSKKVRQRQRAGSGGAAVSGGSAAHGSYASVPPTPPGERARRGAEHFDRVIGTTSATAGDARHPATLKGVGWVPGAGPWKDKAEGIPADTWKEHFDTKTNTPSAERAKLHEGIYDAFIERTPRVPEGEQPVAIVTMGLPASGKSTAMRALSIDAPKFVPADADLVKNYIPEFQEGLNQRARNAAGCVHNESAYLVEQMRDKAIANRQCLIADGTGSDLQIWGDLIKKLKANRYRVHLLMADLPADQCKERIADRAEREGRYVPPGVVDALAPKIHKNFMKLKDLPDTAMLFSTASGEPVPVYTRIDDGPEEIYDDDAYADLRRKSGVSEAAGAIAGVRACLRETPAPVRPRGPLPPVVTDADVQAAVTTGYAAEAAMYASLPVRFARGDGVVMLADAADAP